jgi:uncharacterized protein (TIRG00374 family)
MSPRTRKWLKFTLRWGIAAAGIFYVLKNISLHDRVVIPHPVTGYPAFVGVVSQPTTPDGPFTILDPFITPGKTVARSVPRSALLAHTDQGRVTVRLPSGQSERLDVLALEVRDNEDRSTWPLVVAPPRSLWMKYFNFRHPEPARVIEPSQVVGDYQVGVPYPLVDQGLLTMLRAADPTYLWAAVFIFPLTFLATSMRWQWLLHALEIRLTMARTFSLNMVGAFYNTFMPGSTGGDVLKAYYAAKQVPDRRTRAVMSVLVDRAVGLFALVLLGGGMAAVQFAKIGDMNDPTARACLRVAIGAGAIILVVIVGLTIFYHPLLRRLTGLGFILTRLPMQTQVRKAVEVMEIYRARPGVVLASIILTFPVHATVIVSAMFAGLALGLPISPGYYWVVVPVVVLSGAIPISPQGAGVMEFFAIILTRREGATVTDAFALTMSIRAVQILWNLAGGLIVLRGGYHAPSALEQRELEEGAEAVAPSPARARPVRRSACRSRSGRRRAGRASNSHAPRRRWGPPRQRAWDLRRRVLLQRSAGSRLRCNWRRRAWRRGWPGRDRGKHGRLRRPHRGTRA